MSEQSWWQRTFAAITREYERRIRRASLVTDYGVPHHDDHGAPTQPADDEAEAAEIVNLPKGTPLGRHSRSEPSPQSPEPPVT